MKKNKRVKIIFSVVSILLLSAIVSLCEVKDVSAGTETLTLKAGFYGGPYYEVEVYDDSMMRSLADETVWTYSGVDTGNFMRVCYAWGVPLETLIADAGINLNSVKYLHFGTTDSYQEVYATFSASTLLTNRYFYPDFVKAATTEDSLQITIDYNKVDSQIAGNAYRVPTILAIGSSPFSREEAANVLSRQSYLSPSQGELSESYKYRLLYGQLGISNGSSAYNVQTSDKWVYEINVQLAGSPNLVVERELISGNEGEVGSKYKVTVKAELPSSYNYLNSNIRAALSKQILDSVQNSYDSSKVKITDNGDGTYEMEVLKEGEINVSFSYSRTDYGGEVVSASGRTSMTATKGSGDGGSGGNNENGDGNGSTSGGNDQNGGTSGDGDENKNENNSDNGTSETNKNNSSTQNGINIGTSAQNYTNKTNLNSNNSNTNDSKEETSETGQENADVSEEGAEGDASEGESGATWASTDLSSLTDETSMQQQDELDTGVLAGGAVALFVLGMAKSVIDFLINIGKITPTKPDLKKIKNNLKKKIKNTKKGKRVR